MIREQVDTREGRTDDKGKRGAERSDSLNSAKAAIKHNI